MIRTLSLLSLLLVFASGCTLATVNATVPSNGYSVSADIPYGTIPRQKLDVYRPRDGQSPAGVIVFFYGGHWRDGEKGSYPFLAEAFTAKGFVVVIPDYRLYPETTFPGFVEDGALAIKWVHDHAESIGGDPKRVFLLGHSAGAHIAALLTLDPHYLKQVGLDRSAIRATATLAGPFHFVPWGKDAGAFGMTAANTTPPPDSQPINFANGESPPMLLMSGSADIVVPPAGAEELAGQIQSNGGRALALTYHYVDHVQILVALAHGFRWIAPVRDDLANFFRQNGELQDDAKPGRARSP